MSLPTLLITAPVQNPGGLDDTGAGETVFDQTYVEQFGQADGTLDGVLKLVPGLQFGEDSESVEGLTELRPSRFRFPVAVSTRTSSCWTG